jgi:hypothetical protein
MRIKLSSLAFLILVASTTTAQMVVTRSSTNALVIPAAGSVQGGNGTFFRTDAIILNFRSSTQNVRIDWLPQGGGATVSKTISFSASSGFSSEDFVQSVVGESGLGALVVTAITATGALDPNAQLFMTTRIWSTVSGSAGTTSQQFNGVPLADVASSGTFGLYGHRRDARYRTNVGIVNLGTAPRTFSISTPDGTTTVDVPAMALVQTPMLGPSSAIPLQIVIAPTDSSSAQFVVYGSSVDNITGDAWSSLGTRLPQSNP